MAGVTGVRSRRAASFDRGRAAAFLPGSSFPVSESGEGSPGGTSLPQRATRVSTHIRFGFRPVPARDLGAAFRQRTASATAGSASPARSSATVSSEASSELPIAQRTFRTNLFRPLRLIGEPTNFLPNAWSSRRAGCIPLLELRPERADHLVLAEDAVRQLAFGVLKLRLGPRNLRNAASCECEV